MIELAQARDRKKHDELYEEMLYRAGSNADKLTKFLNSIPHKLWQARSFPGPRYGHVTSNIVESLNSRLAVIDSIRELHPLGILNGLWLVVMEDRAERYKLAQQRIERGERQNIPRSSQFWLSDYARKKLLVDSNAFAQYQRVQMNHEGDDGYGEASVSYQSETTYRVHTVNLARRTCTCGH
jgi:hypothetical protein